MKSMRSMYSLVNHLTLTYLSYYCGFIICFVPRIAQDLSKKDSQLLNAPSKYLNQQETHRKAISRPRRNTYGNEATSC